MPHQIKISIQPNAHAVAVEAASHLANLIRKKPQSVLGLATGSTPEATYKELIDHHVRGLSFHGVRTFNLDEYYGIPTEHEQSYRHFMQNTLFDHLNIQPWNTRVLNGSARFPDQECQAFEHEILSVGGIDCWLLGIGQNGHIAFNEPGSEVASRTRLVALSPETIEANSDGRFFCDPKEVPRSALSAGIGTIRDAREIILLATGEKKAAAVAAALNGPFTTDCPASFLQDHPDCTFILDEAAASQIES